MGRSSRVFAILGSILGLIGLILLAGGFFHGDGEMTLAGSLLLLTGILLLAQWQSCKRSCRKVLRRLERERREHKQDLEQAQAEKQDAIDSYRSELAHGLRMPIAVIQGYTELLAGNMVDDPAIRQDYFDKIMQRCQDMTTLLNRQAESKDALQLDCGQMDLLSLTRKTVEDVRPLASDHEIQIHILSPEDSLPLTADRVLVDRMLYNILENSVKYMGRPGNVTIRIRRQDETAVIAIQDDGLGMVEAEVPHIFEKNFQGANRKNGQGQGLYLARRSVEAHGGTITAHSRPGQGMGIHITLPLSPSQIPAAV